MNKLKSSPNIKALRNKHILQSFHKVRCHDLHCHYTMINLLLSVVSQEKEDIQSKRNSKLNESIILASENIANFPYTYDKHPNFSSFLFSL